VKELHYFDKLHTTRTVLDANERRRVGLRGLLSLDPWLFNYWFGKRSDAWYRNLFSEAQTKGLIAGEITPAYATLDEAVFRRIRAMTSEIKLIFVMRDPVERAWSAVNNALKKGFVDGAPTVARLIERARAPGTAARSAYPDTIKRLEAVFPNDQIQYYFFDDLRDRPEVFTLRVFSFLGVESRPPGLAQLPRAANVAAGSRSVPLEFSRELARDYLASVRELCQRFEGPPQRWCARYEELLNGNGERSCSRSRSVASPQGTLIESPERLTLDAGSGMRK
jgi:hypothetical protein